MTEEFNLSEKIEIDHESVSHHNLTGDRDLDFIKVNDVKEEIRSEIEELRSEINNNSSGGDWDRESL